MLSVVVSEFVADYDPTTVLVFPRGLDEEVLPLATSLSHRDRKGGDDGLEGGGGSVLVACHHITDVKDSKRPLSGNTSSRTVCAKSNLLSFRIKSLGVLSVHCHADIVTSLSRKIDDVNSRGLEDGLLAVHFRAVHVVHPLGIGGSDARHAGQGEGNNGGCGESHVRSFLLSLVFSSTGVVVVVVGFVCVGCFCIFEIAVFFSPINGSFRQLG